jgi:hypothetical protein
MSQAVASARQRRTLQAYLDRERKIAGLPPRGAKPKKEELDPEVAKALRKMMRALRSDDEQVCLQTVRSLRQMGRPEVMQLVLGEVIRDMRSKKPWIREKAVKLFFFLGPPAVLGSPAQVSVARPQEPVTRSESPVVLAN